MIITMVFVMMSDDSDDYHNGVCDDQFDDGGCSFDNYNCNDAVLRFCVPVALSSIGPTYHVTAYI